jgi:hypothetical protein
MEFIPKVNSMENDSGMITEQEFIEFMSLQILGVKNEHRNNGIRSERNGQINKPTQHEPKRNAIDSSNQEASTVPF